MYTLLPLLLYKGTHCYIRFRKRKKIRLYFRTRYSGVPVMSTGFWAIFSTFQLFMTSEREESTEKNRCIIKKNIKRPAGTTRISVRSLFLYMIVDLNTALSEHIVCAKRMWSLYFGFWNKLPILMCT